MLRNPLQRRNKHLIFEVYGGLAFVTASDFFLLRIALVFPFLGFLTYFFSLFSCVLLCGDVGPEGRCVCVCAKSL